MELANLPKKAFHTYQIWKSRCFHDLETQKLYSKQKALYHESVKKARTQFKIDELEKKLDEIESSVIKDVYKLFKDKQTSIIIDMEVFRTFYENLFNRNPEPTAIPTSNMTMHIKTVHNNEKYQCNMCLYNRDSNNSLTTHMKMVHE